MSRSVQELVEQQVRNWRHGQFPVAGEVGSCVALSRLPGAGSVELGRSIAERLGYGFFDREIVEAIAKDAGVQEQLVADLDEHVRTLISRYVVDTMRARAFAEQDYVKGVVHLVKTLAHRGRAVLLGRGATAILTRSEALRVLVVAPRDVCIERIAREHGLTSADAARRFDLEMADRAEFLRQHFGVRQDDPALYDLALNTDSLPTAIATDLVVAALAGRAPEHAATVGARSAGG